MLATVFHADEMQAQYLAGGGVSRGGIRDAMPDQHRIFFEALPYAVITVVDDTGWPNATMLSGAPGFITAPTPTRLRITLAPGLADPALATLHPGAEIGVLGIDLATRRRNRANGILAARDPHGIEIDVQQSFGNCPQYIHGRTLVPVATAPSAPESLAGLDADARAMIARADTFFVASRARDGIDGQGGADISHRGGPPGFVRLTGDRLDIPDYRGNRYFNTLGNLLGDPRAALLFVDFAYGDLLQVQGLAQIHWSTAPATPDSPDGGGRRWSVHIDRAWRWRGAVSWRSAG